MTQLLSRGAQPDAADENGLRALHVACANPDSEAMVRSLLKAKANPNITDDFGCSPIYCEFSRRGAYSLVPCVSGCDLVEPALDTDGLFIFCPYRTKDHRISVVWVGYDVLGAVVPCVQFLHISSVVMMQGGWREIKCRTLSFLSSHKFDSFFCKQMRSSEEMTTWSSSCFQKVSSSNSVRSRIRSWLVLKHRRTSSRSGLFLTSAIGFVL